MRLNVVTKSIYHSHVKLLKVLKAILEKIKEIGIDDDDDFARVTHEAVAGVEDADSAEELFKRRMGIRNYLKLLKTNMVRIRNSKRVKEEAK